MRVVILGASANPERYSYKAFKALKDFGCEVIPVNPTLDVLEGIKVVKSLSAVQGKIHTITLYLSSEKIEALIPEILGLKPERIISNPGTENDSLRKAAQKLGIRYEEACTLVMLSVGTF